MLIIMQKFWQRPGSSSAQPPHSAAGNEQSGASGHIFHILTLIMLNQIVSFHLSTQPTDFFVVMNLSNWIQIRQKSKNIWNYVISPKAITENEAGGQSSTIDMLTLHFQSVSNQYGFSLENNNQETTTKTVTHTCPDVSTIHYIYQVVFKSQNMYPNKVKTVQKQTKLRTLSITVIEAAGAGCRRAQAKIIRVGNEADLYHR